MSLILLFEGLVGFARLLPGDVFEIVLHYGLQKWKSRGKIGTTSQTWEPQNVKLKALLGDVFCIKVTTNCYIEFSPRIFSPSSFCRDLTADLGIENIQYSLNLL